MIVIEQMVNFINLFPANVPFLNPLKMSQKPKVFRRFQEVWKRDIGVKWVNLGYSVLF